MGVSKQLYHCSSPFAVWMLFWHLLKSYSSSDGWHPKFARALMSSPSCSFRMTKNVTSVGSLDWGLEATWMNLEPQHFGTIFSDQPNWRWFGIISGRNYKCVLLCDSWANRIVDLSSFPPHGTAARASRPRRCRSFSFSVAWGWCSKTLRISLSASLAMRALVPLTGSREGNFHMLQISEVPGIGLQTSRWVGVGLSQGDNLRPQLLEVAEAPPCQLHWAAVGKLLTVPSVDPGKPPWLLWVWLCICMCEDLLYLLIYTHIFKK